jgi:hypothetical protein
MKVLMRAVFGMTYPVLTPTPSVVFGIHVGWSIKNFPQATVLRKAELVYSEEGT